MQCSDLLGYRYSRIKNQVSNFHSLTWNLSDLYLAGPRNDSPTRLLRKAQPLDRARTTSTSLVAALHEVHDVLSHPGLSQIPETELADSARLLDDANKRLQRALVRGIQART